MSESEIYATVLEVQFYKLEIIMKKSNRKIYNNT